MVHRHQVKLRVIQDPHPQASTLLSQTAPAFNGSDDEDLVCGGCETVLSDGASRRTLLPGVPVARRMPEVRREERFGRPGPDQRRWYTFNCPPTPGTLSAARDRYILGARRGLDPEAGFSVGRAIGCNRWIYALADRALVVACSEGKGGTWAGAVEALRSGAEAYVKTGNPERPGNGALARHGVVPVPSDLDEMLHRQPQAPPEISVTADAVYEAAAKSE